MAKKKGLKIVLGIIGIVIVLVIVAVGVVYIKRNTIAKNAIERVMSFVLLVDVSVEKVNLQPTKGEVTITNLVIGNPEGFKTDESFSAKSIFVKADIGSFRTEEPVIELIAIDSPRVTMEHRMTSTNFGRLIKNASRFQTEEAPEEEETGAQKYVRIDKITVTDSKARVNSTLLAQQTVSVPLPDINMNDIGGKKEKVTVAEAIQIFFTKIFTSVTKAAEGIVPMELFNDLGNSLKSAGETLGEGFDSLKNEMGSITGGLGKAGESALEGTKDIGGEAAEQAGKAAEGVKKGGEKALEGVTGLFKKKDKDKE